ncbi:hypothetical protein HK096_002572, partial [Nowakowskiella sp. JEL0078]
ALYPEQSYVWLHRVTQVHSSSGYACAVLCVNCSVLLRTLEHFAPTFIGSAPLGPPSNPGSVTRSTPGSVPANTATPYGYQTQVLQYYTQPPPLQMMPSNVSFQQYSAPNPSYVSRQGFSISPPQPDGTLNQMNPQYGFPNPQNVAVYGQQSQGSFPSSQPLNQGDFQGQPVQVYSDPPLYNTPDQNSSENKALPSLTPLSAPSTTDSSVTRPLPQRNQQDEARILLNSSEPKVGSTYTSQDVNIATYSHLQSPITVGDHFNPPISTSTGHFQLNPVIQVQSPIEAYIPVPTVELPVHVSTPPSPPANYSPPPLKEGEYSPPASIPGGYTPLPEETNINKKTFSKSDLSVKMAETLHPLVELPSIVSAPPSPPANYSPPPLKDGEYSPPLSIPDGYSSMPDPLESLDFQKPMMDVSFNAVLVPPLPERSYSQQLKDGVFTPPSIVPENFSPPSFPAQIIAPISQYVAPAAPT